MTPSAQTVPVSPPAQQLPPQAQQLLEQMHGIIAPSAVGWWPPAPGWWILGIAVVLASVAGVVLLRRRYRASAYRRIARIEVEKLRDCPDEHLPAEANRLLKQVALVAFPEQRLTINQAFADAWVSWLNQCCKQAVFTGSAASALAQGPYQPGLSCPRDELLLSVQRWINQHRGASAAGRKARV